MADEIKVGDVVKLKSGGPPMTVEGVGATGGLNCAWFDGADRKEGYFAAGALEHKPSNRPG